MDFVTAAALPLFAHAYDHAARCFARGNYDTPQDILPLTVAVIGLDIVYSIVLHFMCRQMTYTLDFVLLLLVNISVIFQSCFGGVGFAANTTLPV